MATIFAPASAPGRAAVAVIRVSGPAALASLAVMMGANQSLPKPRRAALRLLHDAQGKLLDQALVLYFKAPQSYTGEDTVEYQLHGGTAVVASVLAMLSGQEQHRLAEPGEFTRRAFENGQLDLTEAEAVADLIDAATDAQRAQALEQLGGSLSQLYDGWKQDLAYLLALLEADLDFSDQDLPDDMLVKVMPDLCDLIEHIRSHLNDNRRGEILRDGLQVAIIGAPNAGKSTLLNVLAGRDIAIVSDMPGTTRDVLEARLDIAGCPVILADTAGLRPDQLGETAQDKIEAEGIRRALARAQSADLRIMMFDGRDGRALHDPAMLSLLAQGRPERTLVVVNKSDNAASQPATLADHKVYNISARTGAGLEDLLSALSVQVAAITSPRETPSLTRARHRAALEATVLSLERTLHAPLPELVAEDIRMAIRHLAHITGRVDVEDILDLIFRDFCIGK